MKVLLGPEHVFALRIAAVKSSCNSATVSSGACFDVPVCRVYVRCFCGGLKGEKPERN